jgi:hypothetical protein
MSEDGLSIWVVYDHPLDHPDEYVARRHVALGERPTGPTSDVIRSRNLELVRDELERRGLCKLDRLPEDLPHIIETWL